MALTGDGVSRAELGSRGVDEEENHVRRVLARKGGGRRARSGGARGRALRVWRVGPCGQQGRATLASGPGRSDGTVAERALARERSRASGQGVVRGTVLGRVMGRRYWAKEEKERQAEGRERK
ncbi:hypothetical protein E2562_010283 [Oryza meyeriana var. granulata]|uniref:Uncharacterized protein n=1 Tax=Oryza meyeriana var. granulata TaxID=110450 RepID=A0A6G1EJ45_9ORYZ|nr:hypothetical protein E2562_010283 [Oryza meyeriana var. granulata]